MGKESRCSEELSVARIFRKCNLKEEVETVKQSKDNDTFPRSYMVSYMMIGLSFEKKYS